MSERVYTRSDFDYALPSELIASNPVRTRTESRLMYVTDSIYAHCQFSSLPLFLRAGDVLVLNDTKVMPARVFGVKDSGGRVEILVERVEAENVALCFVKSSRGLQHGHKVMVGDASAHLLDRKEDLFRISFDRPVLEILATEGKVPLPPYINRLPTAEDIHRYQTVYARTDGAVAAPTAGLHFDNYLLARIQELGVTVVFVTLHIGAGTFQPLRGENLSTVQLHAERYEISQQSLDKIQSRTGRCIAVGTTVVRTLEHVALTNELVGETSLFIRPGFRFREVNVLITNFHLPQSSLLMLVTAFCGYERTMNAYDVAVNHRYRFYSYGDAMWCERHEV